jgi:hypothetical protein
MKRIRIEIVEAGRVVAVIWAIDRPEAGKVRYR